MRKPLYRRRHQKDLMIKPCRHVRQKTRMSVKLSVRRSGRMIVKMGDAASLPTVRIPEAAITTIEVPRPIVTAATAETIATAGTAGTIAITGIIGITGITGQRTDAAISAGITAET